MKKMPYYLGLDMGTGSVGWAVTDKNYNLIRKKGKDMWGVRLFETASTSVERRTNRISRRRRQREQVRIGYLKCLFAKEIEKKDPNFFQRLENSKYYPEDKDPEVRGVNGIFADEGFTDKEYYQQFPTIFHLRKELIENNHAPYDVRFVYLALLNMFKHRGHFLNTSLSSEDSGTFFEAYQQFESLLSEGFDFDFPSGHADIFEKAMTDQKISRSRRRDAILKAFEEKGISINRKSKAFLLVSVLCGLKTDLAKLFDIDSETKIDVCFGDFGYEEKAPDIEASIGEDNYALVEAMKTLYDNAQLSAVLGQYKYLSLARVHEYEQHKKDLKQLKKVYKELGLEAYNRMFRSDLKGSYSAYVGSINSKSFDVEYQGKTLHKMRRNFQKKRKREDLYKQIANDCKAVDSSDAREVLERIEDEQFLPKQLTAGNGIIPNQVHAIEMRKILDNAKEYLPFLSETNEYGLTVSEQILQLFSWQIPYYIGPTSSKSQASGGNGWVVRKEEGPVLPWTFQQKVDEGATREKFIENLIRECTYLSGEKVLPKQSLLYQRYCVLNEINNLRIDGERISVDLKQSIYHDLFEKGKRVTRAALEKYLESKGLIQEGSQLSGIDKTINNALTSFGRFLPVLGEKLRTDQGKQMADDIIRLCTIYGDAKHTLEEEITMRYGTVLSSQDIKRILGFKFKDWGNLSREILVLTAKDQRTGEIISLIQALWETQYNFMELINSDRFSFKEELERKQNKLQKTLQEFTYEDLDDYYFSAPVKRMVWQTLQIIKEIEKVMGGEPERVFIEVTREDGEKGDKGRKDSRGKNLKDLYDAIRTEDAKNWLAEDWKGDIETADKEGRLRIKKLYLYYLQWGRCLYTGEVIDIQKLMDDNLYDIDHIYPRHFVKDDSISNNLVLVAKQINQDKKRDMYPIPEVPAKAKLLWKALHDNGFINDEKYRRLTSRSPFTDEQKAGFIARQLVETSQGTKGVADLLKQLFEHSEIVYSKAKNVSDFRNRYKFFKARSLNEIHHAQDAYLNIVVGNVYHVKFGKNPMHFIKNEYAMDPEQYRYHMDKMFDWNVKRGEDIAWIAPSKKREEDSSLRTVERVMARCTPLMTRMSFEGHGGIADATLYSKLEAKPQIYLPLKSSDHKMSDVTKYGGIKKASTAYFFLVEHDQKKKRIRTLEALPILEAKKVDDNPEYLYEYCIKKLKLQNPSIRLEKIKVQSMLFIDGFLYSLQGKTGNQVDLGNLVNLFLPEEYIYYIKQLEKTSSESTINKDISVEKNLELFDLLAYKHLNSIFAKKKNPIGPRLVEAREKFINLNCTTQCFVLTQILRLSIPGKNVVDLREIGGGKTVGALRLTAISSLSSCYLIERSVTGLYEKRIDLLTV